MSRVLSRYCRLPGLISAVVGIIILFTFEDYVITGAVLVVFGIFVLCLPVLVAKIKQLAKPS